ncbi:MAG: DUF2075 domain-containing protein [Eubacteriales bacterium]|nr:DUF2075 domain-containing protein [Eubacteriales bacterium]
MIVYSGDIAQFQYDSFNRDLVQTLEYIAKQAHFSYSEGQIKAWHNSLSEMDRILSHAPMLPKDCGVVIELQVPPTSKRIDFVLTGRDENNRQVAILIELKQWETAEKVEGKRQLVKTFTGGAEREVPHPSYQVVTYGELIKDYNETVEDNHVEIKALAYLHNCNLKENPQLEDEQYEPFITEAPLFGVQDRQKLVLFLEKYLRKGDEGKKILYELKDGEIRPTKSLQDVLGSMLKGNEEFHLIDQQKVVYEEAMALARDCFKKKTKKVMIIEGGPGTGKSVLAINLLVELSRKPFEKIAAYVTKNSAPRKVYSEKLAGSKIKKKQIEGLFTTPDAIASDKGMNNYDALIVDEAHRLPYNDRFHHDDDFLKHIMEDAYFSVFFIDNEQRIAWADYATSDRIKETATRLGIEVVSDKLESQFRCNGADGYLNWVDDVLEIRHTSNFDWFDFDYDFEVFDNPAKMKEAIYEKNRINNKSRLVAGYCWDWKKTTRNNPDHVDIDLRPQGYDFALPWNMDSTSPWATDPNSVSQVGCIHTCQGLEFDYVGVLIGKDLCYEGGHIVSDPSKRSPDDKSLAGWKKLAKENRQEALDKCDILIKNTYRVLMTRGMKGCYVYCCDKGLENYLKERVKILNEKRQELKEKLARK